MSVCNIVNVCWSDVCSFSFTFVDGDDDIVVDDEYEEEEGEEGELILLPLRRGSSTLELNVNAQTILAALHSVGDDDSNVCSIACALSSPPPERLLLLPLYAAADCIRRWVRNDVL